MARNELRVYLNALSVGTLSTQKSGALSFAYDEMWLGRESPFPISRSLPVREEAFRGPVVHDYLENLLPDALAIRRRIAARLRARSDSPFDLLAVAGRDCVGALQFVPSDEEEPLLVPASGHRVSDAEIANKLRNLKVSPFNSDEEAEFRLSIAGAQEKTAYLLMDGEWCIPTGATPTTHIFKPQMGEIKKGLSFGDSVENEWLCAEIAREFGLPVTKCEIRDFEGMRVLVVERFDRHWLRNVLYRLPQEDLCQAFGISGVRKYESDGGPGVRDIMRLLNESDRREEDRSNFMKTQILFVLLAAIDGHAKNFSVALKTGGFALTPLYDILSAQPVVDRGGFQLPKIKLAMAFGASRYYKVIQMVRRRLLETAKICAYDPATLAEQIDEMIAGLPGVIDRVQGKLPPGFPEEVSRSIFEGMRSRVSLLTSEQES